MSIPFKPLKTTERGSHRGLRISGLLTLAVVLALVVPASSALAAGSYRYDSSFGPDGTAASSFTQAGAVAVDQSTHDVYVGDLANGTVNKFDSAGQPAVFSGVGDDHLSGIGFDPFGGASQIAVDNSGGVNDRHIYVTDPLGSAGVKAFDADGNPSNFSGSASYISGNALTGNPDGGYGEACGVAVDAHGAIYVGDFGGFVDIYAPDGTYLTQIATSGLSPCNVAVDSHGTVYANNWEAEVVAYTPSSFPVTGATTYVPASGGISGTTYALGIDPATDDLYGAQQTKVVVVDVAGNQLGSFGASGSGALSDGQGIGVDGATGIAYASDSAGAHQVEIFQPVTPPSVVTTAPSAVTAGGATLNGTVNPEGAALTSCTFQYGKTASYGRSAPCAETTADIGTGTAPVSVHADVSDLDAGATYHVRLVADGDGTGTGTGTDQTFSTFGPPTILGTSSSQVTDATATITAWVNPRGADATYHVEYVDDARFQTGGFSSPDTVRTAESAPLGSDFDLYKIEQSITGLKSNTAYRFRVVVTSTAGVTKGASQPFRTLRAAGPAGGRAWELVSPSTADKQSVGYVEALNNIQVTLQTADDGQSIVYPLAGSESASTAGGDVRNLAVRGPSSWNSVELTPPSLIPPPGTSGTSSATGFVNYASDDLSCSIIDTFEPLTADTPAAAAQDGTSLLYRRSADGTYRLLTPTMPSNPSIASPDLRHYIVDGASSDCNHVLFTSDYTLLPGASGLYEWDNGVLTDAAVLPDGSTASDARAGGLDVLGGGSVTAGLPWNYAMSADGSTVAFSATSNSGGDAGQRAVFVRRYGITTDISQAQGGASQHRGAQFQTLSKYGTHAFFLARYGLTADSSSGGTGVSCVFEVAHPCDLYDYDLVHGTLTDLSADHNGDDSSGSVVAGILGASDDGSTVYFAAQGELVPGQGSSYSANRDAGTDSVYRSHAGVISYVGRARTDELLNNGINKGKNGVLLASAGHAGSSVTPDGRRLMFVSAAKVTGYDSGGVQEVYLYDADVGQTTCVSCRADGKPALGYNVEGLNGPLPASLSALKPPRSMSSDGTRVFFNSRDALAPGASDEPGKINAYEWSGGRVSLLLGGLSSSKDGIGFLEASASGDDVFAVTYASLSPADTDNQKDLYDLRVGGGLPAPPPPPPPCDALGDHCQGAGQSPLVPSIGTSGPGSANAPQPPSPTLSLSKVSASQVRSLASTGKVTLTIKASAAGKLAATATATVAQRVRSVASAKRTLKAAGTAHLRLTLSKAARAQLSKTGKLTVKVSVTLSRVTTAQNATLKLVKAKKPARRATAPALATGKVR
jgi:hypothetical protein